MNPAEGKEPPLVTVLLPVHNAAPWLQQAVESILGQTLGDLELLAIDDGSTDNSLEILRSCTDPRLRVLSHTRNLGLVATLNEGLDLARGRFIARMDADDSMLPDRLALQLACLEEHADLAAVAGHVEFINADGEITGSWDTDRATPDEASVRAMLPRTNCLAHPTIMFRRSALGGLRYNPKQHGAEDWDLWLRMLSRGLRIGKLPRVVLHYRMHPGSIMAGSKQNVPYEKRLLRARWRYLKAEWSHLRFSTFQLPVIHAQARTWARHIWYNSALPLARGTFRAFTYSPLKLLRERKRLVEALSEWKGRHAFVFSYLGTGGAEQVHADILRTVAKERLLVVITGFSRDRAFAQVYGELGILLEVPRLVHHPFTAAWARRRITASMGQRQDLVLFGSNTHHFFHWLPHLPTGARAIQLIHAFLYQPHGNRDHKVWSALFPLVERYLFVSRAAMDQFGRFLCANHVPRSALGKLECIPNAVHGFGLVQDHVTLGLLFIGRDSGEKRLHLFLEVCRKLHSARPGQFRFTVVGASPRKGHGHVEFLGTVNDADRMADIRGRNDLLLLTSIREGFPMVVMEAMAHGMVVLATPVGDVPNRLRPDLAVVTTSVEEAQVVEEMVAAALLLHGDRARLRAMKEEALRTARAEFGMDRFKERYRALLMSPSA